MLEITNLTEGIILFESWGYEQTNIDFYQIVRATEKSIWLRPINSRVVKTGANYTYWVEPVKDDFSNENKPIRKVKSTYMSIGHGSLDEYKGKPIYETKYY